MDSLVRVDGTGNAVCIYVSDFSSVEFVCKRRNVSPLMKHFLTLTWREEKCVYWNVSVALKYVWTSSVLLRRREVLNLIKRPRAFT